jgi:dGTPase
MTIIPLYDDKFDAARMDGSPPARKPEELYRTEWRRDHARLIHSAAFRRLQGKTQLFPNAENDFFRNRLTHSLEVAQIAKSIALKINAQHEYFHTNNICPDIVEIAGLAHDLGHPPFGHNGEYALDEMMREFGGFEGNAQTLRILSRMEKKQTLQRSETGPVAINDKGEEQRIGLNLTARALAAVLKYDAIIPDTNHERKVPGKIMKGFYKADREVVDFIKKNVLRGKTVPAGEFKTVECSIMDVADDIAYSTYDLEDAFKAGFLDPLSMLSCSDELLAGVAEEVNERIKLYYPSEAGSDFTPNDVEGVLTYLFADIFYDSGKHLAGICDGDKNPAPDVLAFKSLLVARDAARSSSNFEKNGYFRTDFTSQLVGEFIHGVRVTLNEEFPMLSKVHLDINTFKQVEVLKNFTFLSQIMSPRLKLAEHRGKDIVKRIFKAINKSKGELLPDDFQALYELAEGHYKMRIICDFVSGMTDRYALEFYGRLYGTNPASIYRPL